MKLRKYRNKNVFELIEVDSDNVDELKERNIITDFYYKEGDVIYFEMIVDKNKNLFSQYDYYIAKHSENEYDPLEREIFNKFYEFIED